MLFLKAVKVWIVLTGSTALVLGKATISDHKLCYNIASRAMQSNSVYVSVFQISIVLADGVSKSLRQKFLFSRERPLLAWGEYYISRQ